MSWVVALKLLVGNQAIDQQLFKSLIEMLRSLSFYKDFESKFFERTTEFYRKDSQGGDLEDVPTACLTTRSLNSL